MGQGLMKSCAEFRCTIERLQHETGIPLVDLYEDGAKWMMKKYSTIGIVSYQPGLISILSS